MMRARLISGHDAEGWAAALDGLAHGIAHTHRFATLMGHNQEASVHLFVAENANGKAVCPIAERAFDGARDVYSPYGFGGFVGAGDLSNLRAAWTLFAQERAYVASYIMQNPAFIPPDFETLWADCLHEARPIYMIDLTLPEDTRLKAVSSRKRVELKRWLATAQPEYDQGVLAQAFVELYPGFAKRRNMPALYHFSKETLEQLVTLPDTCLVGVRGADRQVGCVALLSTNAACGDYLFMASSPQGEKDGAGTLWLGLRTQAARGVRLCNLGGGIQNEDGVAEMKRRLGGQVHEVTTIQQVFDAPRYQALCTSAGVAPDDGRFFPAYHAPASGRRV